MKNKFPLLLVTFFLYSNICAAQSLPVAAPSDYSQGLVPGINPNSGFLKTPAAPKYDLPPAPSPVDFNQKSATEAPVPVDFFSKLSDPKPITQEKQMEPTKFEPDPITPNKQMEPTKFDWKKTNAQRFLNSPCLKTLGFDPNMDPQEQEKRFKECEDAKSNEETEKNLKILLGVLLVAGFGGAIICLFNEGQKK